MVDHGSVSGAARALRVNHATVLRRIAVFEEKVGVHLFDKSPRGYLLPPENRPLIDTMRDVETAALAVERQIAGEGTTLRGTVRITSTDTLCHYVIPHVLPHLHRQFPMLAFDVLSSNSRLDLSRMEADVTIRPAHKLPDHLEGELAGKLGFAAYNVDGASDGWIGLSGALVQSAPAIWMEDKVDPDTITARTDSFLTALALAEAGAGTAILPCILAAGNPLLKRCGNEAVVMSVPVWVASHKDLSQTPRIAAVRQALVPAIREIGHALLGAEEVG